MLLWPRSACFNIKWVYSLTGTLTIVVLTGPRALIHSNRLPTKGFRGNLFAKDDVSELSLFSSDSLFCSSLPTLRKSVPEPSNKSSLDKCCLFKRFLVKKVTSTKSYASTLCVRELD